MTGPTAAKLLIGAGVLLVLYGVFGLVTGGSSDVEAVAATTVVPTTAPDRSMPATTGAPASPSTVPVTPTTTRSPTTTTSSTTTTTTTVAVASESVEQFVELFAAAVAAGDVDFLFGRLHPAVVGGFGPDLCRQWVTDEILQFTEYQLTGPAEGPNDQSFTTPAGTGVIANSFNAPVRFTFQGQPFDSQAGFALVDGEMYWLGQCR